MNLSSIKTNKSINNDDFFNIKRLKFVILGDHGIGKSTLLYTYANDEYPPNDVQIPTIGVDFYIKTIEHNSEKLKLQLWDTSGQERFMTITRTYFRDKNIILLLYDMSKISTFNRLSVWIEEINEHSNNDNNDIYMIGTKKDKEIQNISKKAEEYAKEKGYKYYEISVKNDITKVKDMFEDIINDYNKKMDKKQLKTNSEKYKISEKYTISENTNSTNFNCCNGI